MWYVQYTTFVNYCHISNSVSAACDKYCIPHLWTIATFLTVSVQHVIYTVYHICELLPHFEQCQCCMWYIQYATFMNYCHISNSVSAACDIYSIPHLWTIATFLAVSVQHVIYSIPHLWTIATFLTVSVQHVIYSIPHLWTIATFLTVSAQHVMYTVYLICALLPHF